MKKKMGITSLWLWLLIWPKVTNFNRVWASAVSNHLAKTASKSVIRLAGILLTRKHRTHTQTDRHTDKLKWKYNPPRFRGDVTIFTYLSTQSQSSRYFLRLDHREIIIFVCWTNTGSQSHMRTSVSELGHHACVLLGSGLGIFEHFQQRSQDVFNVVFMEQKGWCRVETRILHGNAALKAGICFWFWRKKKTLMIIDLKTKMIDLQKIQNSL